MYPKWLCSFCDSLMRVSIGLFLLLVVFTLILLPFAKLLSYETLDFLCNLLEWALPASLGIYAATSNVVIKGIEEHLVERGDDNGS